MQRKEAARALDCDDDPDRFKQRPAKLVKHKPAKLVKHKPVEKPD